MWKASEDEIPETSGKPIDDSEKEEMMREMIELQKSQINMLKQAILEKAPELGKWLKLDD
jgi:hypothetical protein